MNLIDPYSLKARLLPPVLVSLPMAYVLSVWSWLPSLTVSAISIGVAGLVAFLLAQVGRGFGKAVEPSLVSSWGGWPTTQLLRHRSGDPRVLDRHGAIARAFPGIQLPSRDEEVDNPTKADRIYEIVVERLRERTRDRSSFPAVFDELCTYGFRRNLWSMRICAFATIAISSVAGLSPLVAEFNWTRLALVAIPLALAAFIWAMVVTPSWVTVSASRYAHALLRATHGVSSIDDERVL